MWEAYPLTRPARTMMDKLGKALVIALWIFFGAAVLWSIAQEAL